MHSAVFVAVEPELKPQEWFQFIEHTNKNQLLAQFAERLAQNVWLVAFHRSPSALAFLISSADARTIAFRILPLADEPQWLPDDPNKDHIP
jgi:hypothetical protein